MVARSFMVMKNNGRPKHQTKPERLRERLRGRPDNDFKVAMIQAIQKVEIVSHPSQQEAFDLLGMAITFYDRKDALRAQLAMFFAGAIADDRVAEKVRALVFSHTTVPKRN